MVINDRLSIEELISRVDSVLNYMEERGDPRAQTFREACIVGERAPIRSEGPPGAKGTLTFLMLARHYGYRDIIDEVFNIRVPKISQTKPTNLLELVGSSRFTEAGCPSGEDYIPQPVLFLEFRNQIPRPNDVNVSVSEKEYLEGRIPFNYAGIGQHELPSTLAGSRRLGYSANLLSFYRGADLDELRKGPMRDLLARLFDPECAKNESFAISQMRQNPPPFQSDYDITYHIDMLFYRGSSLMMAKLRRDGIVINPVEKYQGNSLVMGDGTRSPEYSVVATALSNINMWVSKYVMQRTNTTSS